MPKKLRDRVALGDGGLVEVIERDGVIEIHPAPAELTIVETAGGPVANRVGETSALTTAEVRETVERLRR